MPLMFSALIKTLHLKLKEDRAALLAAYLDDTAAAGHFSQVLAMYRAAVRLAPVVCGFEINPPKTVVFSVHPFPSPAVAEAVQAEGLAFQFEMAGSLGGVIGTDQSRMSDYLVQQVRKHDKLFAILTHPSMPAVDAIRLLRHVLLPKMAYLLRVTPPEVSAAAADLFSQAAEAAYIKIMDVPDILLPQYALAREQFRLPTGRLGEGVLDARISKHTSYLASLANAVPHIQKALPLPPPPPDDPGPVPMDVVSGAGARRRAPAAAAAAAAPVVPAPAAAAAAAGPDPRAYVSPLHRHYSESLQFLSRLAPTASAKSNLPASFTLFSQVFLADPSKAKHLQKALSHALYADLAEQLVAKGADNTRHQTRFAALRARHATAMLNADLSDPRQRLNDDAFRLFGRLIKGMPPSTRISCNPLSACACGYKLAEVHNDPFHFFTCALFREQQNRRHGRAIQSQVRDATDAGVQINTEEMLPGTQKRADTVAFFPGDHRRTFTDTTVTHPMADSYQQSKATSDPMYALASREHAKNQKYCKTVERLHGNFVPLAFTTFGNGTRALHRHLAKISRTAEYTGSSGVDFSVKAIRNRCAAAIITSNALVVHAGLGRMVENYVAPIVA